MKSQHPTEKSVFLDALDIESPSDTRSDIYSLRVLLYELLTGTTPFAPDRLQSVGFDELGRIIREEEPPRPSTRLSTLNNELASTVAVNRRLDPAKLSSSMKRDLDWIVMTALDKDRNRRYPTAGALAQDVSRFLMDQPVEARPPSTWYRFRSLRAESGTRCWRLLTTRWDPAQAEKLTKLPIWAFHGGADRLVPAERSRDMIAALKRAGGEPRYTEYEGVGHDSWTPTYRNDEVLDRLFSQTKEK
jgi:serine/threonine protein kinase